MTQEEIRLQNITNDKMEKTIKKISGRYSLLLKEITIAMTNEGQMEFKSLLAELYQAGLIDGIEILEFNLNSRRNKNERFKSQSN